MIILATSTSVDHEIRPDQPLRRPRRPLAVQRCPLSDASASDEWPWAANHVAGDGNIVTTQDQSIGNISPVRVVTRITTHMDAESSRVAAYLQRVEPPALDAAWAGTVSGSHATSGCPPLPRMNLT